MLGDLTTPENVTAYLGAFGGSNPVAAGDTALIKRLVSAASRTVLGYLNRGTLLSQAYTEVRNGNDQPRMTLRRWPVTSYTSLSIDGTSIPASPVTSPPTYGWRLEDPYDNVLPGRHSHVAVVYGAFWCGTANVVHSYTAGYLVAAEPQTVPASSPWQLPVANLSRPFAKDAGVSYANGTALTAIASGTPAQGQYLAPTDVDGFYQFAAADAAAGLLISYSFTPEDLAQTVNELVGERYAYLQRIGVTSQKAGMSAETYGPIALTALAKETLNFYRDVIPV